MRSWLGIGCSPPYLTPCLDISQPPFISESLMRALVVIATVTKAISHLVARAQERVGVFREHLLGMSWPQEAVCTQGDGVKGGGLPSRHMSRAAHTHTVTCVHATPVPNCP